MAELSSLFSNLGPAGASILMGTQMGQEANKAQAEQQLNDARLQAILQETDQAKQLNPLILQAKQQELASAKQKALETEHAFHTQLLGEAIPYLEKVPNGPGQRLSALNDYITKRGGHALTPDDLTYYGNQPDLVGTLKKQHEWAVTQDKAYRREMDKTRLHNQGQMDVERERSKSRAEVASMKAAKTAGTIEDQAKAGKLSYEKAATAFTILAMNADTVEDQQKYQQKAAQFEQLAAKLRAAGNTGKVDVGAATNLPTTGYEPVLVPGATPPANPNSPKVSLPPGWSVNP